MGRHIHVILWKDIEKKIGECTECGVTDLIKKDTRYLCKNSQKRKGWKGKNNGRPTYAKFKGTTCERCGFDAINQCQLDIHHKDHNHSNNSGDNLETLCANCHRLEHFGE